MQSKNIKNKLNNIFSVIFLLFGLAACSDDRYQTQNVTHLVIDSFEDFAKDSDTVSIRSITLSLADKRFYAEFEHSDIEINYEVNVRNNSADTVRINLPDSSNYATYLNNRVGWLSGWNKNELEILPCRSNTICITNIGMFGALYRWEKLFPPKHDYTFDMLKILPDIKVYYNGQLVLPSKEIEIFTSDYKDPWIYRVLKKISGEPYAIDFSNKIKTNVIDRLLKSKLKDNIYSSIRKKMRRICVG